MIVTPRDKTMALLAPYLDEIAARYGVEVNVLLYKRRRLPKRLLAAHREIYALLYDRKGPFHWSKPRIAAFFNRDHTTIVYHLRHLSAEQRSRYTIGWEVGHDQAL